MRARPSIPPQLTHLQILFIILLLTALLLYPHRPHPYPHPLNCLSPLRLLNTSAPLCPPPHPPSSLSARRGTPNFRTWAEEKALRDISATMTILDPMPDATGERLNGVTYVTHISMAGWDVVRLQVPHVETIVGEWWRGGSAPDVGQFIIAFENTLFDTTNQPRPHNMDVVIARMASLGFVALGYGHNVR